MKKLYIISLFVILIAIPALLVGQPYCDLLNIQKNWYNNSVYKNDPNGSLNQATSTVSVLFPVEFKSSNVLLLGFDYLENSYWYKSDTSYHAYLESHVLDMGFIKNWKKTPWTTTFIVIPRIASKLKNAESSDYQLGGVVLATYKKRNSLKFKFGMYYNREFFGNSFLPLLGIDWKISSRLYLFGVLPGNMNLEYKLSQCFHAGVAYKNNTYSYRINNGPSNFYVLDGNRWLGNNHLFTFVDVYPLKNLVIFAGAGFTLFHYYQLYTTGEEKISSSIYTHKVFNEVRDGAFFQLGAALRIRMDKDYVE